jgi:Tat protein secretion system quality control protein TatD with DNase activity
MTSHDDAGPVWATLSACAPSAVAIGETGPDYHFFTSSPRYQQRDAFVKPRWRAPHCRSCHIRDALTTRARSLTEHLGAARLRIHCFT